MIVNEIECPFDGIMNPAGSTKCRVCETALQPEAPAQPEPPASEPPPQPEPPAEPAAEPPAPEPLAPRPPAVRPPAPPAQPPAAPRAPAGRTPSIADLVACPNPGCFGVVAPTDAYCAFCGRPLPAAYWPAPPPPPPPADVGSSIPPPGPITRAVSPSELPPPEPFLPPAPAGAGPAAEANEDRGHGFLDISPAQWMALIAIPAAGCFFVAVLLLAVASPQINAMLSSVFPPFFSWSEVEDQPTETPTRVGQAAGPVAATTSATTTPSATPSGTPRAGVTPSGTTTKVGTPTMTPDPGWKPLASKLAKGEATVPATADRLFSGVTLFSYADNFAYEIIGRGENCRGMTNGRAILWRRSNGVPTWQDEESFVSYVTMPNNGFTIRADDPGLQNKQWVTYPCP